MIDFNCYIGNWPFNKLERSNFCGLQKIHKENNVEYGYISSIDSVFYNDIYESEKELYNTIKESGYKQIVTVDPSNPNCILSLKRCVEEFDIAGVRITPCYHNYTIDSECVKKVAQFVKENNLPLFITGRMMDERLTYLVHQKLINIEDLKLFLDSNKDIVIILNHFRVGEIYALEESIISNPDLFFDTSGIRTNFLGAEINKELYKKCVLGSAYPLCALKSNIVMIENEFEDEEIKNIIFSGEKLTDKINKGN